jgi:hypothetical protein
MKLLVIFLFMIGTIEINSEVLEDYHKLNSEKSELAFIKKYKNNKNITIMGYVCSMEMKQATYTYNPMRKLSIFKEEKANLESLIKKEPNNAHLRYIRYFVQLNTPSILNYNENLNEDKKLLANYLTNHPTNDLLSQFIKKNCQL